MWKREDNFVESLLSILPASIFPKQGLSLAKNPPIRLDQLPHELQGSAHLHLSRAETTRAHHHTQRFDMGSAGCPQAYTVQQAPDRLSPLPSSHWLQREAGLNLQACHSVLPSAFCSKESLVAGVF